MQAIHMGWRLVSVVAALVLALGAATASGERAAAGPRRPVAIIQDLDATIDVQVGAQIATLRLTGTQEINLTPAFALRSRITSPLTGEIEQVVVDGLHYTRQGRGAWEVAAVAEDQARMYDALVAQFEQGAVDIDAQMEAARAAGIAAVRLPDEVLGGVPVRRDRIEVERDQFAGLLRVLPPDQAAAFGGTLNPDDLARLPDNFRVISETWTGIADQFPYRSRMRITSNEFTLDLSTSNRPVFEPLPIAAPIP